jgi:hypothetical protein
MVTQLQDVSNTVAKEKISSDRLRNESIRKNMANPWSAPTEDVTSSSGTSPLTLQSTSTKTSGATPTMASTYSALKNNFDALGLADTYRSGTSQVGGTNDNGQSTNWKTQGWAPSAAGLGASLFGAGPYSGLASGAVNFAQGNKKAAAANITSSVTNALTKGKLPGAGGVVGSLVSGILGDKDAYDIGKDVFNSGLGTVIGMTNPVAGIGYSLARMLGLDVGRGLSSLFDTKDYASEGGHAGGFITPQSDYTGYTPGQAYEPGTDNLTPTTSSESNSGGYTPAANNAWSTTTSDSWGGYSPSMSYSNYSGGYSGYSGSSDSSDSGGGD